ncbi:MAG TPA: peptidoglycan-binding protein [Mycobacteriales bacterium]|nr:peptidoglycan-binding protein [Mycobacteriales bacterium]
MGRSAIALSRAIVTAAAACVALAATSLPAVADPSDPPTQGTAPAPTVTSCATLDVGTTGAAVSTIQTLVGADPDGDFGPQTSAALKTWQNSQGIPATGVVDNATWAVMPAATAAAACAQKIGGTGFTVSCAVLSQDDTGPAVAVLETALDQPVDGQFSPDTAKALSAAQQAAGLPVTARTSRKTWKALKLTGTPVCTPGSTTPALPKDWDEQQKVRKQVAQLAADLLQQPGATTSKIALKAVRFEKRQIGKPYVYGAAGPDSYDCSGLQMRSYLHAGLTLPRVAADQYAGSGPTVPLDQAQAGDLLFFASDVLQPSSIYHVAMYIGGGEVLDAPHTGANVGTQKLWTTDLLPVVVRPVAGLTLPLQSGATGWSVTQLQQMLNRHGARLPVDGGYGPDTQAAVQAWQQAHDLAATGVVRLKTWLSLSHKH